MNNSRAPLSNICLDYPHWQFMLDISKLCSFIISLESSVLPYWCEGENSGGIRVSIVKALPPPMTRTLGVLHQEGFWPV